MPTCGIHVMILSISLGSFPTHTIRNPSTYHIYASHVNNMSSFANKTLPSPKGRIFRRGRTIPIHWTMEKRVCTSTHQIQYFAYQVGFRNMQVIASHRPKLQIAACRNQVASYMLVRWKFMLLRKYIASEMASVG